MIKKLFLSTFLICLFSVLYISRVDNSLTSEDIRYIKKIIKIDNPTLKKPKTFKEEIEYISKIQKIIIKHVEGSAYGIKLNAPREVKDYYFSKNAICYDRSRIIEKVLRYLGYETRHVSIYSTKETNSFFISLLTPGITSHALTEVKTKNGWMIVDSIVLEMLYENNNPISMKEYIENDNLKPNVLLYNYYQKDFVYVYGLYSRHGRFYPPYNFVPDIEWNEFMYNLERYF